MKLSEFIQIAQNLAGDTDPELILWDEQDDVDLVNDADTERWDWEITKGDNQIVLEIKGPGTRHQY